MRILRNSRLLPIYSICALAIAARFGFVTASLLLLMNRFQVSPMISAIMCVCLQGVVVAMQPISVRLFRVISLNASQKMGAILGLVACIALMHLQNLILFLFVVFLASFSRVAIEGTFPRVTHGFILEDHTFASRLIGCQQGSLVVLFAVVAPIAITGSVLGPMAIMVFLYLLILALAISYPQCGSDTYEEVLTAGSPQDKFERRFGDIVRNEVIREHQSRVHRFRRVPATLLSIDLFINIIVSGSIVLTPLCFISISKVPQSMDSVLAFAYGGLAAVTGLILLPLLRKKFNFTQNQEWIILACTLPIAFTTSILYSTIFGLEVGVVSAGINGVAVSIMLTFIQQIGARNLTQMQFQKFGCQLLQRNALARIVTPLVFGSLASFFTLRTTFLLLALTGLLFSLVSLTRVILIVHGRKLDHRTLLSIENTSHPARRLRTNRRSQSDVECDDTRLVIERLKAKRIQSQTRFAIYNKLRFRYFLFRTPITPTQKERTLASTRGTPR